MIRSPFYTVWAKAHEVEKNLIPSEDYYDNDVFWCLCDQLLAEWVGWTK